MMLGTIILIASCVAMYRIAELGDRRGWVWATITFLVCIATASLIPIPLLNLAIGFALTWVIMIGACIVTDQHA